MASPNVQYIIRGNNLPGVAQTTPPKPGYATNGPSVQELAAVQGDLVRMQKSPDKGGVGAGPIFQRPSPADLLTGAAQSKDEQALYDKILYIEKLESALREAEQEKEAMHVVYEDIVRRVKKSTGSSDASTIHELETALAMERRAAEQAVREKNELITRMSKVMTESVMRTERLQAAENLVEELVSAHKDAEVRAKHFEQQLLTQSHSQVPNDSSELQKLRQENSALSQELSQVKREKEDLELTLVQARSAHKSMEDELRRMEEEMHLVREESKMNSSKLAEMMQQNVQPSSPRMMQVKMPPETPVYGASAPPQGSTGTPPSQKDARLSAIDDALSRGYKRSGQSPTSQSRTSPSPSQAAPKTDAPLHRFKSPPPPQQSEMGPSLLPSPVSQALTILPVGTLVMVQGLVSRNDLNGLKGFITSHDARRERYEVQVKEMPELLSVKANNLQVIALPEQLQNMRQEATAPSPPSAGSSIDEEPLPAAGPAERVGLGMVLAEDDDGRLVVEELQPGKGADACGNIMPGDILLMVDGHPVGSADADLHAKGESAPVNIDNIGHLSVGQVGSVCRVILQRGNGKFAVDVTRVAGQ